MAEQGFDFIWRASLLFSMACVLVLMLRPLLMRLGALVAYQSWLLVPLLLIVPIIPARTGAVISEAVQAWRISAESVVVTALPVASSIPAILFALWVFGVVVAIALVARQHVRYVAGLRWIDAHGHWRAADGRGPALLGLIRPRLVLPDDFETQFDASEQSMILVHEDVHRQRRDNVWNVMATSLVALQWFNPLAYVAWRRMRADQEIACDATVIQRHPNQRSQYARALMKAQDATLTHSVACTWKSRHPLIERIIMLNYKSPSKITTRTGNVILSVTSLIAAATVYAAQGGQVARVADVATAASTKPPYTALKPDVICPNAKTAFMEVGYPKVARREFIEGEVVISYTVLRNGDVSDIEVTSAPIPILDNAAIEAVGKFKCNGQEQDIRVRQMFGYKLQ